MQKLLTLEFLKRFIASKQDINDRFRPNCSYVSSLPPRKKYNSVIRTPSQNFLEMMFNRNVYLWVIAKKNIESQLYSRFQQCYKSVKYLTEYQDRLPICQSLEDCQYWTKMCGCQIIVFEDIFQEIFPKINKDTKACGFYIVSVDNIEIAKIVRRNSKIHGIYEDQKFLLKVVKQNMERLSITKQEQKLEQNVQDKKIQKLLLRNSIFPNFIKLSKYEKSQHNQHRINLLGIRKMSQTEKFASKDRFIELCKSQFKKDLDLIYQYETNPYTSSHEILNLYSLDSFFFKALNNTLRIAKSTEQFFAIGEPFNKVFEAIQKQYHQNKKYQNLVVYRGASLTPSQCQYLEKNIDNYIQINGFVSTSRDVQEAKQFARQMKSKTIFKIILKQVPSKYKQFDYGYVDFGILKCAAYEYEKQILINALNIFKIKQKYVSDGYNYFVLEYGAIYQILDKDPQTLKEEEKYPFYCFKQLMQANKKINDIGQVYLQMNQPEKAIQVYEDMLVKAKQQANINKAQQIEGITIKVADAYLANSEPDKALKYYESIFLKKKQKKLSKRYSLDPNSQNKKQNMNEMIQLSTKVTSVQNIIDRYENADQIFVETSKQINQILEKKWEVNIFWSKVELQWQASEGKKIQMRFKDQFNILKQVQHSLLDGLDELKDKAQFYEQKKIKIKLIEVYEAMAQAIQQMQKQNSRNKQLQTRFDKIYVELYPLIKKNSYEEGVINIRKIQIQRRTKKHNTGQQLQVFQKSIDSIKSNTNEDDQFLPKALCKLANLKTSEQKSNQIKEVINIYKQQLQKQILKYSQFDAKILITKTNIANLQRDNHNLNEALNQFRQAFDAKLFKSDKKYSIHALILFNMAQAYIDKGDDGLALNSLKGASQILQNILSNKDFQRSVLRFKIKLRMGRVYMNGSILSSQNLSLAKKQFDEYYVFMSSLYKHKHRDIAIYYNYVGSYFAIKYKLKQAKQNLDKSISIYEVVSGTNSLDVARMKANLSICYAQKNKIQTATKLFKESQYIYYKVYNDLLKSNPFQYQIKFIHAKIEYLAQQYQACIKLCQQAKKSQKEYLQKRNQVFVTKSEVLLKKNSLQEINKDEFLSGFKKKQRDQRYNSMNLSLSKNRLLSQTLNLKQISTSTLTIHRIKCDWKICNCLRNLKRFAEAEICIRQLKKALNESIQYERKNNEQMKNNKSKIVDFRSMRFMYLKKCDQLLQKVTYEKNQQKQNSILNNMSLNPQQAKLVSNDKLISSNNFS